MPLYMGQESHKYSIIMDVINERYLSYFGELFPRRPRFFIVELFVIVLLAILELATNFWLLVLSILHNHKHITKQASLSHWVASII